MRKRILVALASLAMIAHMMVCPCNAAVRTARKMTAQDIARDAGL